LAFGFGFADGINGLALGVTDGLTDGLALGVTGLTDEDAGCAGTSVDEVAGVSTA
jgi:hypothetical protein